MSIDWGTAAGALSAMGAGLCLAFSNVYIRQMNGARGGSPSNAVFWGLAVNVAMYALAVALLPGERQSFGQLARIGTAAGLFYAASGVAGMAGRRFKFGAVLRLGPTASASFRVASPMITVVVATLFLGERLTLASAIGVLLILSALVVIGLGPKEAAGANPAAGGREDVATEPIPAAGQAERASMDPEAPGESRDEGAGAPSPGRARHRGHRPARPRALDWIGIALGMGSATAFAAGDLLRKVAVDHQAVPLVGALIGSIAALAVHGAYRGLAGEVRSLFQVDRRAVKGFIGSGVFSGLAVLLFITSLTRIPVSTAAPLSSVEPVANLLLSRFIFRGSEPVGRWLIASVAILLVGVTLLIRDVS